MNAALRTHGLSKAYGSVQALSGLDLEVPRGGIFGVVGANGAGKTTLFSVISGYLRADEGSVEIDGVTLAPGAAPPVGRFAILPQDASFIAGLELGPQLVYYGQLQGLARTRAEHEARRVLDLVGLPEVYSRRARTLSHGMHKRVGIAQAFIGDPGLVILDEPTAGLDPHAARGIRGLLRQITGERTVIVSSHNLGEVEDLCEAVAIVHQGRLVRQDTIAGVIGDADLIGFRLGRAPTAPEVEGLRSLGFVQAVDWNPDEDRLRVRFDPGQRSPGEAARDLVAALVDASVPFVELQIGKSLEDRFIEETGQPSAT